MRLDEKQLEALRAFMDFTQKRLDYLEKKVALLEEELKRRRGGRPKKEGEKK